MPTKATTTATRPADYKLENRTIKSVRLTSENGRNSRIVFELDGEPFVSFDFKTGEEIKTNTLSLDVANVGLQLTELVEEFQIADSYLLGANLPPALISFVLRNAKVDINRIYKEKGEKRENANDVYTANIYKSVFTKVSTNISARANAEIDKILNRIAEEASKPQKVETTKTTTTFGLIW